MKLSLARRISFYAGNLLPLVSTSKPNPYYFSPLRSNFSRLSSLNFHRTFSSETSKSSESNLDQPQDAADDIDIFSNQDLKKQIDRLYKGEEDAFAKVFETLLRRSLAGNTDKLDEELMNDLPNLPPADEDDDGLYEGSSESDGSDDEFVVQSDK